MYIQKHIVCLKPHNLWGKKHELTKLRMMLAHFMGRKKGEG